MTQSRQDMIVYVINNRLLYNQTSLQKLFKVIPNLDKGLKVDIISIDYLINIHITRRYFRAEIVSKSLPRFLDINLQRYAPAIFYMIKKIALYEDHISRQNMDPSDNKNMYYMLHCKKIRNNMDRNIADQRSYIGAWAFKVFLNMLGQYISLLEIVSIFVLRNQCFKIEKITDRLY